MILSLMMVATKPLSSFTANKRSLNTLMEKNRANSNNLSGYPNNLRIVDVQSINSTYGKGYEKISEFEYSPLNDRGFISKLPDKNQPYYTVTKFVISCCAVDASPVNALLESKDKFNKDQWIKIRGKTMLEHIDNVPTLVIVPEEINKISPPNDPYEY